MVKVVIKARYPNIKLIPPYRLEEEFSRMSKTERINIIGSIMSEIERWINVKRNYNT